MSERHDDTLSSPRHERRIILTLWRWCHSSPRRMVFLLKVAWRLWQAYRRRKQHQCTIDGVIPSAVAISPTMRCNYNCGGCYSRGRPDDQELSTREIDSLFTEAEALGVTLIVVTGGEPLLRDDMLNLMVSHQRLLFAPITNGSLLTYEIAHNIAKSNNIIPFVSIEGFDCDTNERRQAGAHEIAIHALECLRDANTCFGFAAMTTIANMDHLSSDAFIDQMVALGCAIGFFIEYVPCGPNPKPEWSLDEMKRATFCRRVFELQRSKPIVLSQFPYDEYGEDNICKGAGRFSLHINAQGDIEPCPFVSISRENIRQGGLLAACQSPFLRVIREQRHLLQPHKFACSLFEHREGLEAVARQFDANTNRHAR